ncbi:MAG: hypothetical protein LBV04_03990 [Deferribacteraceae bacterium]|jgi:hypothetical protein|nr:hypothetical protein [Deferribacteraceae bacterium]
MTQPSTKKQLLGMLEDLARQMDIRIRYEKTTARGGLCKHNDKYQIIIDRKSNDDFKIDIIAAALKSFDLSDIYIAPKLRDVLEIAQ